MAKQDVEIALEYDAGSGVDWQPAPAYTSTQINLSRGAGDEGQVSPPSAATLQLDDRSGDYNPSNPTSALYGLAGQNTPMRISLGGSPQSATEASGWQQGRSATGTKRWADMDCGGILRRLGTNSSPVKSPAFATLTTAASQADSIGYWPLEEEKFATSVSGYGASPTLTPTGLIDFGAYTGHPAATRMLTFGADGRLSASVRTHTSTGEYKFVGLWHIPSSVPTDGVLYSMTFAGGTLGRVDIYTNWSIGPPFEVISIAWYGPTGTLIDIDSFDVSGYLWDRPCMVSIELTQDGSDIDIVGLIVNQVDVFLESRVLTGQTMGTLVTAAAGGNAAGCSFGHFDIGTDTGAFADFISPNADGALGTRAFVGEHADYRFGRLCDENGIAYTIVGTALDTQTMGTQPSDTLVNCLAECARTDAGLMFEPRDVVGLVMRTGRDLINQASALDLSFTGKHVSIPLAPITDDRYTRNDITAKRRNGGTYRAFLASGRKSIQPQPDGVGQVEGKVDVNPELDADLVDHAYWWLHRGTVDEVRYPTVTIDVTAQPAAFVAAVNALDIGDRITLSDLPTDWSYDTASLLVLGIKQVIGSHSRRVTLNCVPASAFEVGIVGADDGSTDLRGQAVDTDKSTLGSGISATATSLSVASTGGVVWTTDSNDWSTSRNGTSPDGAGLFITIGGETMRVTNITGASSPQTFTVVRSVNGVVKSHLAGAPVHARYPARVGL